jgi:hypothetical protein
MHLALSDQVRRIITAASVHHAVSNEKKPVPSLTGRLMRAMILLDKIVEVCTLPQFARGWYNLFCFQFLESFRIGSVFFNADHSRSADMRRSKSF